MVDCRSLTSFRDDKGRGVFQVGVGSGWGECRYLSSFRDDKGRVVFQVGVVSGWVDCRSLTSFRDDKGRVVFQVGVVSGWWTAGPSLRFGMTREELCLRSEWLADGGLQIPHFVSG